MVIPPPPRMPENGNYASDPAIVKQPSSPFLLFMNITNTITQLLLGAVACSTIMFANQISSITSSSFSTHIYLCVIGYVVLMSQAILSISPFTGWANSLKYQNKRTVHWVMQILGSALAISGSIVRIANINRHFQTAHGAFGIVAFIFTCLSMIGGVANLFSDRLGTNPKFIKIVHAFFGSLTIISAFLALLLGLDKTVFRGSYSHTNANMIIVFTVFALVGTVLPACVNMLRRFKN